MIVQVGFLYRVHCLPLSRFICCVWVDFQRLCSSLVFVSVTDVFDKGIEEDVVDDDDGGCCLVLDQFPSVDHFSLKAFEEGKLFIVVIRGIPFGHRAVRICFLFRWRGA